MVFVWSVKGDLLKRVHSSKSNHPVWGVIALIQPAKLVNSACEAFCDLALLALQYGAIRDVTAPQRS
jgi:hypothetical protein